jgi:hypothetical protein
VFLDLPFGPARPPGDICRRDRAIGFDVPTDKLAAGPDLRNGFELNGWVELGDQPELVRAGEVARIAVVLGAPMALETPLL